LDPSFGLPKVFFQGIDVCIPNLFPIEKIINVTHVFNPLDEGLKNEISALRKSYDSALNQLDRDTRSS
jgi:hypothetical protein